MYGDYLAGPRTTQVSEQTLENALTDVTDNLSVEEVIDLYVSTYEKDVVEWIYSSKYETLLDLVEARMSDRIQERAEQMQREADAEGGYDG